MTSRYHAMSIRNLTVVSTVRQTSVFREPSIH